jgi:DNA repair protein RecO
MPHHIYHTHALVVARRPIGEADAMIELFTQDLGRLHTHARGIRKEVSRLRYALQPMSWVMANVVRGNTGWRLTTAHVTDERSLDLPGAQSLARVTQIIRRFLPHESVAPQLFLYTKTHHDLLAADPESREMWEALTLSRMFHSLGYWGDIPPPKEDRALTAEEKHSYIHEINRILRVAHT